MKLITKMLVVFTSVATIATGLFLFFPLGESKQLDLASIITYVHSQPENPLPDNTDIIKPDYTSFIQSSRPGFVKKRLNGFLNLIRRSTPADFSPELFKLLLESVSSDREEKNYAGHFVQKITPHPESRIVIWGDIEGALHSLVRCLIELRRQGIIGEDLTLTSSHDFLVFLGDTVGRSPYNLQTLMLIAYLMKMNPDQVIYLEGDMERASRWESSFMSKELTLKASALSAEEPPFKKLVDRFFATLPRALYIPVPSLGTFEVLRLSYFGRSKHKAIDEKLYGSFLLDRSSHGLATYVVNEQKVAAQPVKPILKALIKSEKKTTPYEFGDGLRVVQPDKGATAWALLSCPIMSYQKAFAFNTDSFAIVDHLNKASDTTITHYAQDIHKTTGFMKMSYHVFNGETVGEAQARKQQEHKEKKEAKHYVAPGIVEGVIKPEDVSLIEHEQHELEQIETEHKDMHTGIVHEEKATQKEVEELAKQLEDEVEEHSL